jgi:hypothetical protein
MIEAASTSETMINFYQTTRHNKPEGSHLVPTDLDKLHGKAKRVGVHLKNSGNAH